MKPHASESTMNLAVSFMSSFEIDSVFILSQSFIRYAYSSKVLYIIPHAFDRDFGVPDAYVDLKVIPLTRWLMTTDTPVSSLIF